MIILNEPIVSPILLKVLEKQQIPVLEHGRWRNTLSSEKLNIQKDTEFFKSMEMGKRILTNSENGITLLGHFQPNSNEYIWSKLLKDKSKVRNLTKSLYPDFYFQEIDLSIISDMDKKQIPFPVVIKPNIGYSSVGVHKVKNEQDWDIAVSHLKEDLLHSDGLYDSTVVGSQTVLIEEWIQGEEYAIDGYFNQDGEPIILNAFKRLFKDDYDTSDRIYYTSKIAVNEIYDDALQFMKKVQTVLPLRNYPVHFEIRKKGDRVIPIEINPLRFAGAGTTDLGYHAYGMNMYEHYFLGTKPDWNRILEEMDDNIYSFFFAEVPLEINLEDVERINHIGLQNEFEHILEYRQLPFQNDRSMAIIFYRSEDLNKNLQLLHLDLFPFLTIKELALI
ncbi:ATP-grasp domain-containing protein [Peribacillus sp. TH16]|uniref:ATP-grasp domain-containing protein n=1 Tax=unclassified Peribacillus TaxID=2675266 RepID=UPI001912630E|nr:MULTISPECIES: ATP-grasp domain-containing protein [unclassified Peribacillus]MBK5460844.1 ATP-grasp domain-containing protein [Peribacillus sp. TH27]MBK5485842.1 ATP-grasp domain-containing protein [Peribacillus sp. TH16]WMX55914.1 ATP-grasp domain-containing protein [Peribacillus sp. R9-11]